MGINILAILIASVVEFIIGALWYGPLFGKMWMKIHDCDTFSKAELDKMQKEMMPYYGVQFFVTVLTTVVLAIMMNNLPEFSPFLLAVLLWLGFMLPAQVSAIIFGRDPKKWVVIKSAIMGGGALACLLTASIVLSLFK